MYKINSLDVVLILLEGALTIVHMNTSRSLSQAILFGLPAVRILVKLKAIIVSQLELRAEWEGSLHLPLREYFSC